MSSPPKDVRYRFGPFDLDPTQGRLSHSGSRVKVQDLPLRLLILLVERPGELVTREELRLRLWPLDTFVEFDNSLGVAVRKLREALCDDANVPRYVETVHRRGYRFVAPVSVLVTGEQAKLNKESEPAESELSPSEDSLPEVTNDAARNRYWIIACLVLVIVGVAMFEFRANPRQSAAKSETARPISPTLRRRSVAVLGFRNLTGHPDANWLSNAFTEMLSTELAAGGGLRLVPGEDVARAKRELPLTEEDTLAKPTLERLRTNPGAEIVVLGAYTLVPGRGGKHLRLDIRLQDTAGGETLAEEALTGSEDKLFELAALAGQKLRQNLNVNSVSVEAISAARASLPSNQEAVRLYAEGRARLWAFDFQRARELLLKAVAADPDYPLAHSALSEAWWHQGYLAKARSEAQRALELSRQLPQEEQLLVEGQYRRAISDWPKTVQTYQSLFQLFPDRLDYGLLLASAQIEVVPDDSLRTLQALRQLPPPSGNDARIDMMEASALIGTDFTKARSAAQRAIEKASAQGSHVLVARTYGILCQQGPSIEASVDTIHECQVALQSSMAAGDINGEAMMMTDLAVIYYQQGDLARAEKMWRYAIQEFRKVGNPDGVATALNNLGSADLMRGNLSAAKKLLEESIPGYQTVEDKSGVALSLNNLGDLSRQQGDLQAAEITYQQAKATAQEIDDKNATAYVLAGLGDVLADRGDLAAARKSYEESLALREQAGEKQAAAETQVALARLAIEEGHAADAESTIRKCKEQFHREQAADDELTAGIALAHSLLAENKSEEARTQLDATGRLAKRSHNTLIRLQFDLEVARVLLGSQRPDSSRRQSEEVLRRAQAHRFVGVELETRVLIAECEKKLGNNSAAQRELAELENNARSKGYGLVVHKASSAR